MLAPRKKLWSTPTEVLHESIRLLNITYDDIVYDIGCGDGRFLVSCAESTGATCIGIEIDEDRAEEARINCRKSPVASTKCQVICGNALDYGSEYSKGTVFFLYLVPRGLKLILSLFFEVIHHPIRVVTYMSPFPRNQFIIPTTKVKVHTALHPDAAWPLFLYHITPEMIQRMKNNIGEDIDVVESEVT